MTGAIFDINTGTGRCNSVELFSKALPDSDSEN